MQCARAATLWRLAYLTRIALDVRGNLCAHSCCCCAQAFPPSHACWCRPLQAYCTETFGSTKLGPVVGQGLSALELQEGCERIMNLLRLNFYTLDYTVSSDLDRGLLTVSDRSMALE